MKFTWVKVLVQGQGSTTGFTVSSRVLRQYRVLWCRRQRTRLHPLVSLLQPLGSNHRLQYCDLFWFSSLLKSLTSRCITWLSSSPWRWALSPSVSHGENKLYPQDRDESFQKHGKPKERIKLVSQPEQIQVALSRDYWILSESFTCESGDVWDTSELFPGSCLT